jgi:transposase
MSADVQRWSKRRKMEAVLRLLRGETLDEVSRDLKVEISRLEAWRDKGIHGIEEAMKEREGDPLQAQLNEVNRRLGELMMENELLRIKASRAPSFLPGRSRK